MSSAPVPAAITMAHPWLTEMLDGQDVLFDQPVSTRQAAQLALGLTGRDEGGNHVPAPHSAHSMFKDYVETNASMQYHDGKICRMMETDSKIVTVLQLSTTATHVRNELIERLDTIARAIRDTEPGTTKYAAFIPREDDGKTVWIVEEYANKESYDVHSSSEIAKDLQFWLQSTSILTAAHPSRIHNLQYINPEFEFSRPAAIEHSDPHVVFAELKYIHGGVATAIPYWKAVVETGRENEPGTLAYGVLRDMEDCDKLATLEVYDSPEYLKDVHVPSHAISESIRNTKHLRTGLRHHVLCKVTGFLHRE